MFHKIWNILKDKYVYTATFVIALMMMVGAWIIGEIGPFGGKCLVVVDGVHQYLPFFSEYQDKLQHLGNMQYSFAVGLGNNFLSLWSYYLSSPMNLIIILCSKSHLPMALNLIISVKIILASVTFAYFLMHAGRKPEKNPGIIVFSLFYAFSSFVVGYYWNLMWLDCIYIFPIVMLGMERMFTRKDSRLYMASLLYCFICNYYISFMICMFLVLWFFTFRFESIRDFFVKGIRFAIASLITAAMSAVVLLPAYKGIMTTASAEFEFPEWEFYGSFADTLRSHLFCSEVMTNQVGDAGTNLYCGLFTVLLAFMFFFVREISLGKKLKYALLLIMFIISFNNVKLNYIWHGFHNQYGIPNRFAFLYIFILLMMAYEVYLKRRSLTVPMLVGAYVTSMLFVIFCYFNAEITYDTKVYIVNAVLLTIYFLLLVCYRGLTEKKWIPRYILIGVALIEMAVNGSFAFKEVGSSEPDYYYGDTKNFVALRDKVEEGETGFCRSDVLEPIFVDEATWYNLNSVGIFGSTVRGELVEIMGKLGFYTGANEYLYYGATPVTNALFGVKYVYTREGDYVNVDMEHFASQENISVYKNPYALPIGYMVNDSILTYDTEDNGPFTVLNELSGALTGIEPVFSSITEDMDMTVYGTNLEITKRDEYNADYSNANNSARADIIYTIPYDMDLYVSCRGDRVHKIALLIDGNEVAYDRYQGQLFHVGKVKQGQMVDIQFVLNDGEDLKGDVYCYPMEFVESQFQDFYSVLADRGMEVISHSDTKIEGKITAQTGQMFMTTIPYDEGWTLYVDGEETDTCVLLEGFLGAELSPGDHEIKLIYHAPGLRAGFGLTIFGIFCFWLMYKLEKEIRIKEEQRNGKRENCN